MRKNMRNTAIAEIQTAKLLGELHDKMQET